jgi:hypothetical protein
MRMKMANSTMNHFGSGVKKMGGVVCKTEPFVQWKSQCVIKAREEAAANPVRLQSSGMSYERHGPHEWNMMGDQIGYRITEQRGLCRQHIPSFLAKRSQVLRPLTVAKSNGPWIKVSAWVRLTQQRMGSKW